MKKTILIVEDDIDIAENLVCLLEMEGYKAQVARDGKEALDQLRARPDKPGLILLDLMMPAMDGFQFREKQLADPELAKIPVAIMTAGGNIESRIAQLNVSASFRKPLDIDKLLETIEKFTR
jgi:DNA-binding response OmpR family regulator